MKYFNIVFCLLFLSINFGMEASSSSSAAAKTDGSAEVMQRQLTHEQLAKMQRNMLFAMQEILIDFGVENYDYYKTLEKNYFNDVEKNDAALKNIWDEFLTKNIDELSNIIILSFEEAIGEKLAIAEKENYIRNFKIILNLTMYEQVKAGIELQATIYKRVQAKQIKEKKPVTTKRK